MLMLFLYCKDSFAKFKKSAKRVWKLTNKRKWVFNGQCPSDMIITRQNKNCLEGCWSCFNVVWVLMQGSSGNPHQFHTLPGKNKSCLGSCKKSKQKWSSQIQKNCQGKQKLPWKLKNVSFSNWSDNKENKSGLQTNIALNSPMKIE